VFVRLGAGGIVRVGGHRDRSAARSASRDARYRARRHHRGAAGWRASGGGAPADL